MKMKIVKFLVLGAVLQGSLAWAEPTLDQVYEATRSGRLSDAQTMMQEVLRAHPNSAKAHFVEAEVLARSGDQMGGRSELALAEKLQPGLPFASPASVSQLQAELNRSSAMVAGGHRESAPGHTPWGTLLVVGGLALLLVIWLVRRQAAQSQVMAGMGPRPMGGYYNNGGMGGVPPGAPMGGGGGGIMGSLATGAALGAGMVAGEALAHRLADGPEGGAQPTIQPDNPGNPGMGGADFGVSDNGSWDSGGGSDWSSGDSGGGDWT